LAERRRKLHNEELYNLYYLTQYDGDLMKEGVMDRICSTHGGVK
jgi:hypothetical protein